MTAATNARATLLTRSVLAALCVVTLLFRFVSAQEAVAPAEAPPADEEVVFYTTYGYLRNNTWVIPLRIWIHEKPNTVDLLVARAARSILAQHAELDELSEAEKQRFSNRAADFIADNESRERVIFAFDADPDTHHYQLASNGEALRSDLNGLIEGEFSLADTTAQRLLAAQNSQDGWLSFEAVSAGHRGAGGVRLIPPTGLSVVSDIDDTIKVTNIPDGEAIVLNNTFFAAFVAAPCMAATYRGFASATAFHYVSGGPWQLYRPLAEFLFGEPANFPRGSFHMKNVRSNPFESESYGDVWKLIANGSKEVTFAQKVGQISTLIEHFPQRTFMLIGDSGERDPEIFRHLRQTFPGQIHEVRIRDVVNDHSSAPERLADMTLINPQGACDADSVEDAPPPSAGGD